MMYPEDQEATKVWDEYLFGEDLLVAPVSDETEEREIYFPEGRWISLWNLNDEISGPVQRSVEVPIDKIPVYIREGSFLPLRLNESLKLGESMSESETEMILAVVRVRICSNAMSVVACMNRTSARSVFSDSQRKSVFRAPEIRLVSGSGRMSKIFRSSSVSSSAFGFQV